MLGEIGGRRKRGHFGGQPSSQDDYTGIGTFPITYHCKYFTISSSLLIYLTISMYLWTARRSNQSILKEIIPEISLEGMMLKLKLQYFGHLMWRVDSLEKTLMLGDIGGRRGRGRPRMRWLDSIMDSMDVSLSELWEMVRDREAWHAVIHGVTKSWTRLRYWTELHSQNLI